MASTSKPAGVIPANTSKPEEFNADSGLVEVTLLKDHEHGGVKYVKGDPLKVRPTIKSFLEKAGVIAAPTT